MRTVLLKTVVLACSCLFTASFPSLAKTNGDTAAAAPEDTTTAPSHNVAEASLQSAVARAIKAAFSPTGFVAEAEPAYPEEVAFFPDQAQGNPQQQTQPPATNPAP